MKTLIIFAITLLAFASGEIEFTKEQEEKIVNDYFARFNIRAGRGKNADEMKKNILKRAKDVEEHNQLKDKNFEVDLNEFSYLSEEEFVNTKLGFNPPADLDEKTDNLTEYFARGGRASIPDYWNWAQVGSVVQPVQDQSSCGSCYAFAAIGAIEGSRCRYHGLCTKLSEQEAMECTNLCKGGWDDWVYDYTTKAGGSTSSSYWYTPYARNSCVTSARGRVARTKVRKHIKLPNNAEDIRSFLFQYGPLFVAFHVYENFYNYKSGIYDFTSGKNLGGHAVLLVGYGTENGVPYWILKNSWGPYFGEKGYFRMRRGSNVANVEGWKVSFPWVE